MNWTREQRAAIDAGGENILLAAAAGSGKTAVLVERIIKLITDENNAVDVNRLLVLTFTTAAAREMKHKISVAIEKRLELSPHNENLKRQRLLLSSANISTIHSFCLEILKANIHLTDIPVDFSICSEKDYTIILTDCISDVLSEYYKKTDKLVPFKELVDGYGGKKNDNELRSVLKRLYEFSISMPNPIKWLNDTVNEHKRVYTKKSVYGTIWDSELKKIIREYIERIEEFMEAELSYCEEYLDDFVSGEAHPYTTFFTIENGHINDILLQVKKHLELEEDNKYDTISELLDSIAFQRLVTVSTKSCPEMKPFNERAKVYRQAVKDEVKKLCDTLSMPESVMTERICVNYKRVKILKNLIVRIMRKFRREKLKKNLLDFNDLEHEMLNLICEKNGALRETAYALKERYEEILIDEYQDTNYIQDAIFKAISRDDRNIFMVGDIKQSIYMFRNAVPKLFLEKHESYRIKDENDTDNTDRDGSLICLNRNFRSRGEVVDTVNFLFDNLMSKRLGSVEYNENERLIAGAVYPECERGAMDSEFMLIYNDSESDFGTYEVEAKAAALKVCELVKNSLITDKETGKLRHTEYKDIVILIRNANTLAPVYEKVFAEEGIPIYTGLGRTYLSSVEVQTILSFLQIIDNPYQDIPLIAVMRSPIFAFTADELAEIRSCKRSGYFYDALLEFAKTEKSEKVRDFVKELTMLRVHFEFADIHSIIWHIYYNYNYFSLVGMMEDSALKQENLRLLYNIALDFENSRFEGLFGFMNYIDSLIENGRDLTVSSEQNADSNLVTLMSIHKSKGLEFPVVLLSGISKQINFQDVSKSVIWNDSIGISLNCYDEEIHAIYPSVTTRIMAESMTRELISEEMRLLYVALTRAKEKLIILTSIGKRNNGWKKAVFDRNGRILSAHNMKMHSMQEWILSALLRHKDAETLRELCGICEQIEDDAWNFDLRISEVYENDILTGNLKANSTDDSAEFGNDAEEGASEVSESDLCAVQHEIKENLFKEYRYKILGEISTKVSVTELKRMKNEANFELDGFEEPSGLNLFDENSEIVSTETKLKTNKNKHSIADSFVAIDDLTFKSTNEISHADIGTIVHFVMQHIDLEKAKTAEGVTAQLEEMIEYGMLTKAQTEHVKPEMIVDFANSDICKRMMSSNMLKKEFKFYISIPVSEIYEVEDTEVTEGETVLMQGIVDCFFEEDDGFVILDYKTDRIPEEIAERYSERYKTQLDYYQSAIEKIFKKAVKEKFLYYLDIGKSVEIR